MRTMRFAALLFTSAAALALSSALPVQSFPQWVTIEGEGNNLIYNFNSLKSLPNYVKQIDIYIPSVDGKSSAVMYISCSRWRSNISGDAGWKIIPVNSTIETLAFKLCGT